MARLLNAIQDTDKVEAKAGWLGSARYEDGTPVAYIASIQEFGDPEHGIPSRSFMRTTFDERGAQWSAVMRSGVKEIASGKVTTSQLLERVALVAAGDIRLKIASIYTPPLATATLQARHRRDQSEAAQTKRKTPPKSTNIKPLVDTRVMINTLVGTVTEKSK